ncbi:hypothetical protein F8M49_11015 [Rhodococcus zopfii]|uniref:Uncharacterized protein n=1 Tax=Rhodococcus zopfii TaxID=43772 RepID=A0ABU3WP48_9NOCA|nr:hypothetical protein [Rhodococcus zopfii]
MFRDTSTTRTGWPTTPPIEQRIVHDERVGLDWTALLDVLGGPRRRCPRRPGDGLADRRLP